MADKIFPQDGDSDSGANFSLWTARSNISGYVETGMGFTTDHTNENLDIGSGRAYVLHNGEDKVIDFDARSNLAYATTSGTNHVFLNPDYTQDDVVSVHIDADNTPPSGASLKIGTVDAANDTHTELNRDPRVVVRKLVASGTADIAELVVQNSTTFNTLLEAQNGAAITGTADAGRVDVNGTTGAASTDGSVGIGAPTVYTSMVEAPTEKGTGSTYIELGSGGYHTSVGADEIGLVTGGNVKGLINNTGDFTIEGTYTENASL